MHSGFPDVRDQLTMDFARTLPLPELRPETQPADATASSPPGKTALTAMATGGGFLFGRFSVADCMYAPVVSRFRTYGVALPRAVQAYMDRMWALAGDAELAGRRAQKEVRRTGDRPDSAMRRSDRSAPRPDAAAPAD